MKADAYLFTIDREYQCLRFSNGYWFPIEDLNRFNANISGGLFHLSKKSFISDSLFEEVVKFCKKEFPDSDFDATIGYIKQRKIDIVEMFKTMGNG